MKRAAIGMVVVLTLTLGFASRGEGAAVFKLGCVTTLFTDMRTVGKVKAAVKVGGDFFHFHAN